MAADAYAQAGHFAGLMQVSASDSCHLQTRCIPVTDYAQPRLQRRASTRGMGLDINVRKRSQVHGRSTPGTSPDGLRRGRSRAKFSRRVLGGGDTAFVLNLAEVTMIDSTGIGLLVRFLASTKQRGGNIKLVQPSKFAVQTLRLVGVLNLFEIFENDDAAVESFA